MGVPLRDRLSCEINKTAPGLCRSCRVRGQRVPVSSNKPFHDEEIHIYDSYYNTEIRGKTKEVQGSSGDEVRREQGEPNGVAKTTPWHNSPSHYHGDDGGVIRGEEKEVGPKIGFEVDDPGQAIRPDYGVEEIHANLVALSLSISAVVMGRRRLEDFSGSNHTFTLDVFHGWGCS